MKDWKSELSEIKIRSPESRVGNAPTKEQEKQNIQPLISESIKPTLAATKILTIILKIESLNIRLGEILPFALIKGNSKKIKQFQNEINILKNEFTSLAYKYKPSLISGSKVPNTNALIIQMKSELMQSESRYQKMLMKEISEERKKKQIESEVRVEEEKRELQKQKDALTQKALSLTKEFKIEVCVKCKDGESLMVCDKCDGTGLLNESRKEIVTIERFSCSNLKPNCEYCGGTGFGRRQGEILTFKCDKCVNGECYGPCKACKGTKLSFHAKGKLAVSELLDELMSNQDLLKNVQEFVGLS